MMARLTFLVSCPAHIHTLGQLCEHLAILPRRAGPSVFTLDIRPEDWEDTFAHTEGSERPDLTDETPWRGVRWRDWPLSSGAFRGEPFHPHKGKWPGPSAG